MKLLPVSERAPACALVRACPSASHLELALGRTSVRRSPAACARLRCPPEAASVRIPVRARAPCGSRFFSSLNVSFSSLSSNRKPQSLNSRP